jgi:DNA-directed RNA polymerase subunit RPC12/RpoP
MSTTVTITCPECDKQITAPADVVGKKIRCKKCGHTFAARADGGGTGKAPAKAPGKAAPGKAPAGKGAGKPGKPPAKAKADEDEEDANPYAVTDLSLAPRCPECANDMEGEDAVICLHCGYNTLTRERARTRKVRDITFGDRFWWWLPGIACALTVVGLITIDAIYCTFIGEWVDKEADWYGFLDSLGIKLWLCIVSVFFMWVAGKFAVKRLVFHPTPPEVEMY